MNHVHIHFVYHYLTTWLFLKGHSIVDWRFLTFYTILLFHRGLSREVLMDDVLMCVLGDSSHPYYSFSSYTVAVSWEMENRVCC